VFQESIYAYNPLTGAQGSVIFGGQTNPFGFYVQDDWKVKSNLSLTLSLRWDDFGNHTAWGNNGFQFSTLILSPGGNFNTQVANASVGALPQLFSNDMKNLFTPRIGFSWDPTHKGQWESVAGLVSTTTGRRSARLSMKPATIRPESLVKPSPTSTRTRERLIRLEFLLHCSFRELPPELPITSNSCGQSEFSRWSHRCNTIG
jgi:TonB dependent receptor